MQGQIERQNDTLNNCLAILATDHPDSWPELLPKVAYAFNSGKSATTELSPFELLFKQQPDRPQFFLLPPEDDKNGDEDYKPGGETKQEKLAKSVRKDTIKWVRVIQRTKSKIEESQRKQAARIKKHVYRKGYNLNDLVIKKNHQTSGGKLCNYYQGPYVVVDL